LRIFVLKKEEVRGGCKKLHMKELPKLYCSPDITRVIKSRKMRWVWHVAFMGEMGIFYKSFSQET
jgi:hypothetical protein